MLLYHPIRYLSELQQVSFMVIILIRFRGLPPPLGDDNFNTYQE